MIYMNMYLIVTVMIHCSNSRQRADCKDIVSIGKNITSVLMCPLHTEDLKALGHRSIDAIIMITTGKEEKRTEQQEKKNRQEMEVYT